MAAQESPVIELQQLATDTNVDLQSLLRKALLVAAKLGLAEFREWIDHELNGYPTEEAVPRYRKVRAEIWLKNPYHGLVPVMFADIQIMDALCKIDVKVPVGSLGHVLSSQQPGASQPIIPLSPQQTAFLLANQDGLDLPPVRTVSENQLASILDSVRNTILEWALKLEQEGILGEGISFSRAEVKRAGASTQIQIGNFQGILGNVQDSSVTQSLVMNVQKADWNSLEKYLRALGVEDDDISDLEKAVKAEPTLADRKVFGDRVGSWMGKMITKAARGVWHVGIGVASSLLASAIRAYYGAA